MRQLFKVIGLCLLWSGFACADIKVQVIDAEGKPVENAVVSVPRPESASQPNASTIDTAVMDQVDKQFLPHVLLVKAGQPVVFPNSDQVRHHVYSFSKPNDFEIRLYSGTQVEPVSFIHPGVVVLGCNIHDQMVGYLYVQENKVAHVSDTKGYVSFKDDVLMNAADNQVITIWHSQLSNNKTERVTRLLSDKNAEGEWVVTVNLIPEVKKTSRKFKLRY